MQQMTLIPPTKRSSVKPLAICELPADSQPIYRIKHLGPSALSNLELLQLIGRFRFLDTASQLLTHAECLSGLARMSIMELSALPGE